jgi:hypothetical protein
LFMHLLGIAVLFFFGTSNNSLSFCFFFFFFLNFFRALEFCCRCMCFFLFFCFVFLRRIRTIFIILHDSFQLPQRKWALDKLMKVRPWVNLDKLDPQISQTQHHWSWSGTTTLGELDNGCTKGSEQWMNEWINSRKLNQEMLNGEW